MWKLILCKHHVHSYWCNQFAIIIIGIRGVATKILQTKDHSIIYQFTWGLNKLRCSFVLYLLLFALHFIIYLHIPLSSLKTTSNKTSLNQHTVFGWLTRWFIETIYDCLGERLSIMIYSNSKLLFILNNFLSSKVIDIWSSFNYYVFNKSERCRKLMNCKCKRLAKTSALVASSLSCRSTSY